MAGSIAHIHRKLKSLADGHRSKPPASYLTEPDRLTNFTLDLPNLSLDWSLQRMDHEVMACLVELGDAIGLRKRLAAQFAGAIVNTSENRATLHSAMRGTSTDTRSVLEEAQRVRSRISRFANDVLDGTYKSADGVPFTDVLHIGIGGSHLAQKFLCDALGCTHLRMHFLTNTQDRHVDQTLAKLDAKTTLVIVASKSFSTSETLQNCQRVQQWCMEQTNDTSAVETNFVYVTANQTQLDKVAHRGFRVPDEVGGRFSVWSAMGLPVLLAVGVERFEQLLDGAAEMDHHTLSASTESNAAILLALIAHWNIQYLNVASHGVLSYCHELRWLSEHLQQLEMESLGKSTTTVGERVAGPTTPVIWGGEETDGQHAWHQWLHQGTHAYSADFIAQTSQNSASDRWNLANCLAQHHVTFAGYQNPTEPHKSLNGGNGSTLMLLNQADAKTIGMLVSLYEHKVACLGYLWDINPFDQWGVERGKVMSEDLDSALTTGEVNLSDELLNQRVRKILENKPTSK